LLAIIKTWKFFYKFLGIINEKVETIYQRCKYSW